VQMSKCADVQIL